MTRTKIEWCDWVFNPVIGCTGSCPYCYARKMAHRFHRDFTPHWEEKAFNRPMPRKPSRIFVNSMSDVAEWQKGWVMAVRHRIWSDEGRPHLFLFLTKHPRDVWGIPDSENVLIGATVTNQDDYDRRVGGLPPRNFLSIEPIHGPIKPWGRHSWIIVGAETGNRKGKVQPDPGWVRDIYEYATDRSIPLFFKDSLRSVWPFDGYDHFPQELPPLPVVR